MKKIFLIFSIAFIINNVNAQCILYSTYYVLTPNGDGLNDWWEINLQDVNEFEITIYNRLGEIMLQGNEETGFERHYIDSTGYYTYKLWDGSIRNTKIKAKEGAYYYVINYTLKGEEKMKNKKGIISLIPPDDTFENQ